MIPKVTPEQRLRAVKRALEHAESLGVTSVQDVGADYEDIAVYADLANRGELTVRVYAVPAEGGWYDQAKLGLRRAFGSPWLRIGAVRAMIDPAPGCRRDPHAADGGRPRRPAAVRRRGRRRSGIAVLDLLDDIARGNGGRDRRFRLDGSHIAPADLDRLASLNVGAPLLPARPSRSDHAQRR